jgi:hypothetical protein
MSSDIANCALGELLPPVEPGIECLVVGSCGEKNTGQEVALESPLSVL